MVGTPLGPRHAWPQDLRTVVNLTVSSGIPIATLWGSDPIVIYNDAYAVIAGHRHPGAMGRSMREVWPEAWEFNAPIFERVMARGESVTVEDQLFRIAQGGEQQDAYFTFSCSPIRSHVGQVVATMVVLLETKQHEARYRSIVEQSSDGIFVADSHGQFVEANPAACQLLGRTASDVLGSTIASVVADSAKMPLRFPELLQGKTIVGERQVVRSDGTRVSVELSARRMSDGRFLGIVRDLTERKRAEELLRDGQDRLRAILDTVGDPYSSRTTTIASSSPIGPSAKSSVWMSMR